MPVYTHRPRCSTNVPKVFRRTGPTVNAGSRVRWATGMILGSPVVDRVVVWGRGQGQGQDRVSAARDRSTRPVTGCAAGRRRAGAGRAADRRHRPGAPTGRTTPR